MIKHQRKSRKATSATVGPWKELEMVNYYLKVMRRIQKIMIRHQEECKRPKSKIKAPEAAVISFD